MTTLAGFQQGQLRSLDNLPPLSYQKVWVGNVDNQPVEADGATSAAPIGATYIVQIPNDSLTNEQALSDLTTGILLNTVTDIPSAVLSIAVPGTDYIFPNLDNLVTQNVVLNNVTINGSTTTQGITFTSLTQQGATIVPLYTNNIGSISVSELLAASIQSGTMTAGSVTAGALFTAPVEATINFLVVRSLNNTSPIGSTPVATLSGGVNIIGESTLTGGAFTVATDPGTFAKMEANKITFEESGGSGSLILQNNYVLMSAHRVIGSQFTIDCELVKLTGTDGGGEAAITLTAGTPSSNVDGTLNVFCNILNITADNLTDSTANFSYDQITIRSDIRGTDNNFVTLQGKNANLISSSGLGGTAAVTGDNITLTSTNSTTLFTENGDLNAGTENGNISIQSGVDIIVSASVDGGVLQLWGHDVNVLGNVVIGDAPALGVSLGDPTPPSTTTLTINTTTTFEQGVTFEDNLTIADGLSVSGGLTISTGGISVTSGGITNTGSLTTTSLTTTNATIPTYVSKVELPTLVTPIVTTEIATQVPPLIATALSQYTTDVVAPAILVSAGALTLLIEGKQDSSTGLTDIANINVTNFQFLMSSLGHWAAVDNSTVRDTLGLSESDDVSFSTVTAGTIGGSSGISIVPVTADSNTTFIRVDQGEINVQADDVDNDFFHVKSSEISFYSDFSGTSANSKFSVAQPSIFSRSVSVGTTLNVTGGATTASLSTGGISVSATSTFSGTSGNRTSVTFNSFTDVTFNGTVTFPGSGSYQPLNAGLTQISAITTPAQNTIIYANSSNQWVGATGDIARGVLGLATTNSPTFVNLDLTGTLTVAGTPIFGTPVPISGGGTGEITQSEAFDALSPITNVGDLIIGIAPTAAGRLGIGGANTYLVSDGTTASWELIDSLSLDSLNLLTDGFIQFDNSTTDPAPPVAGGILYVVAGALKYIGSDGTITTLAIA